MTAWFLSAFRGVCQKLAHGQQVRYASLLTAQPRKSSQNPAPCHLKSKFGIFTQNSIWHLVYLLPCLLSFGACHCEILRSKNALRGAYLKAKPTRILQSKSHAKFGVV